MGLSSILVGIWGHEFLASGLLLAMLGLFGGLYLVPQTTIFQARSPAARRGEYLALQNFMNYTFMLGAALLFDLLTNRLALGPREIFIGVGVGLGLLGAVQAADDARAGAGPVAGARRRARKGGGLMMVRAFRFMLYIWMRIFHGLPVQRDGEHPEGRPRRHRGQPPELLRSGRAVAGDDPARALLRAGGHPEGAGHRLVRAAVGHPAVYRGGDNEPTVQKALRVLQRGGAIGIFPEGRRSLQFAMGTARPGVGRLAVQGGAKIVPCVIYGTWKAWPHLTALPHPAKIVVDFLPAITVDPIDTPENHKAIAQRVRELIVAEQLKHRVGPAPDGSYREAPDY